MPSWPVATTGATCWTTSSERWRRPRRRRWRSAPTGSSASTRATARRSCSSAAADTWSPTGWCWPSATRRRHCPSRSPPSATILPGCPIPGRAGSWRRGRRHRGCCWSAPGSPWSTSPSRSGATTTRRSAPDRWRSPRCRARACRRASTSSGSRSGRCTSSTSTATAATSTPWPSGCAPGAATTWAPSTPTRTGGRSSTPSAPTPTRCGAGSTGSSGSGSSATSSASGMCTGTAWRRAPGRASRRCGPTAACGWGWGACSRRSPRPTGSSR